MSPRRKIAESDPGSRVAILRAARALVLKHGHERLSLREVARRAGFSPASLYEYFDGKADLLREVAVEANAGLRRALEEGAGRGRDARGRLVEVGLAYVGFAREHAEDFLLLFSRLPSKRRSSADAVAPQSAFRVLADAVARAVDDGVLRAATAADAEAIAYGLWAAAHGMAQLQLTHLAGFGADFERADRAVLEALVAGFQR